MGTKLHRRPAHHLHALKCSGNASLSSNTLPALHFIPCHSMPCHSIVVARCIPCNALQQLRPLQSSPTFLLPLPAISKLKLHSDLCSVSSPSMACALVCSSPTLLQSCAAGSRIWTSDARPRQDLFSGKRDLSLRKVVSATRRSPEISAAVRSSSSEASADVKGRYSSACIDQPCALSCPVKRDTNVERLVEESVHEIVKNIQEAPFLQYVFHSKSKIGRPQRQKISQNLFESPNYWPSIREALSKVDPDGVILVQKLDPGCAITCCLAEAFGDDEIVCPLKAEGAETNVWGVLVQGRDLHANACYLLKTTRVSSSAGICTRYCLTRAKCFGPSHIEQLENAWLL